MTTAMSSALAAACADVGIVYRDVPADGRWYVTDVEGDRRGKGDGRIKLFPDGEGGIACNWKGDIRPFFARDARQLSGPKRDELIRKRRESVRQSQADEAAQHAEAAIRARTIWERAKPAPENHPYLTRKGIGPHGARLEGDSLVIPLRENGEICSLQSIAADGVKRFLPGGRTKSCYFSIGNPRGASVLCLAEGFATGATLHEATGHPVAVAFTAGNLGPVAKAMREKFPGLPIALCADDDAATPGNPGLTKATEAARAVGGRLAVPDFGWNRPEKATDFNDLASLHGLEAVQRAIANAQGLEKESTQAGIESALASDCVPQVQLVRASDLKPEAISWLWKDWLAAGKMHVLGGAPGTGKTTISMALAATLTIGGRWPDGTRAPIGNVVIWSGEDDPADTLIPRLVLSGADRSRVFFVTDVLEGKERRPFDPAQDMEPLRRRMLEIGEVRLLIVDPIVSAIAGDSHKNVEVRRGLQPLSDLAAAMRCALLGITHFSKGTGGRNPVERLTGSVAFGAAPRVVMVAAKHEEEGDDGRTVRLLLRAKSNIGPDDGGFEYDLHQSELKEHPGIFASSVAWGDAVDGSARELLAVAEAAPDDDGGGRAEASAWLRSLLMDAQDHTLDKRTIVDLGRGAGFSESALQRAKGPLGVECDVSGFGREKRSVWVLPSNRVNPANHVNSCHTQSADMNDTIGDTNGAATLIEVEI